MFGGHRDSHHSSDGRIAVFVLDSRIRFMEKDGTAKTTLKNLRL